jgi:SNF2 family DNA or RNA helicase
MNLHFKTEPYAHQRKVVEQTLDKQAFALFAEQGTGKTKMTLDTYWNLGWSNKLAGLLIIAPNGVHANWIINEVPKHFDGNPTCLIWEGKDTMAWHKKFFRALQEIKEEDPSVPVILAMNIEAVRTQRGFDHARKFLEAGPCMMVIDESTIIKNPQALQTKQVLKLAPLARYRRVLTGTPITQGPLDLYSQIQFLDPGIWPHGSWTAFKHDFAIEVLQTMGTRKFTKIVGYRNIDKMTRILKDHVIQLKKVDCLDLPDKIYMERPVQLTEDQRKHYDEVKGMAMTMIEEGMVTATNALTLLLRLQQIVCGHVKDDDGNIHELTTNRIGAMLDIIEEVPGHKVIIWAHFKADIRRIVRTLCDNYGTGAGVAYFGETDQMERSTAIRRFQEDPECRFFVGNEAASRGITLTASDTVIYYSNNTKLEYRLQSEDRNHRIGQKNNVVYHDLVAYGTVDEKIFASIKAKENLANLVMSGVVSLKDIL